MALRIRLRRMGRKKAPHYRIVIAESAMARDGRFVTSIGYYNPKTQPATVQVDREKALLWIGKGAVPTETVHSLLKRSGVFKPAPAGVEAVAEAVVEAAGKAARAVKGGATKAKQAAAAAAAAVGDAASAAAETAQDAAASVTEAARDAAETVVEKVRDAADAVGEAVTGDRGGDDVAAADDSTAA